MIGDQDNCPADGNPGQQDADGDNVGDACDQCIADPGNDIDDDGLCAESDNCPDVANSDQADRDGDGTGDSCDNCADIANFDQKDTDNDQRGDRCDICPLDPANDGDQDGLCADRDNCPAKANPEQADCDRDGIGNACDDDIEPCIPEDMVFVPAGSFWRGSCNESTIPACDPGEPGYALPGMPDIMDPSETPLREIFIDAYFVDKFEVTVRDFETCVSYGTCKHQNYRTQADYPLCNYGNPDRLDYPMNCVTLSGATDYATFVAKRLPTEAEWEKAARGTDGRKYPWGNDTPDCSYLNFASSNKTCVGDMVPVGSYPKGVSPYGAYDMAGNVWEWVSDWYGSDYYKNSPATNPTGPDSGTYRANRGGSFGTVSANCRTAARWFSYNSYHYTLGFRLVRSFQ
jgi:formylglycine-generating enzyme required for sulfatase activity